MTTVATTCPYCGVGCGVQATVAKDGTVAIAGDPAHPANAGRLCSKGRALGETLGVEGRLLYPQVGGRQVDWDSALDAVARGFARTIHEHGPDAVAFYVSGQLLTEDYYVANKLMKGFIGAANIDTNSRLCMASAVAAHQRAFGADAVPGCYDDITMADLVVIVGSNTAWCHPILFQRLQSAKQGRPGLEVVVIDPRRTSTATLADLHLGLRPGTDAVLFNGLLNFLRREDALDLAFLEAHVEGYAETLTAARNAAPSIPAVARVCGLDEEDVARFYRAFARTPRTVTLFSQGINQSTCGTDQANAIINCHLATGRVGQPGAGPFSLTGQPNAMGGREVGGLATQLAAHHDFDHADAVQAFWGSPSIARAPGLKAVSLFDRIARGEVRAVWIMATNPAVSLPDADRVRAALRTCDFVVVSDCVADTDTTALAHVLLPAAAWGEKDGTVTNSERRLSRQRAFLAAPGDAKPDWWIVTQVARRLGYTQAFPYQTPAEIFREHARLSGINNDGRRTFDISGLADLSDDDYGRLAPVPWPVTPSAPRGTQRLFTDGRFPTVTGKARLVPITVPAPQPIPDDTWVLNTGRARDQWHTMTRTGRVARLSAHAPEPYVEIHPSDAARLDIQDHSLVAVEANGAAMTLRVRVEREQQPGSLFVPIHWSDRNASAARVGALIPPQVDPISGQPAFKHAPVRVRSRLFAWHAFLLTRDALSLPLDADYWIHGYGETHHRYEIAGDDAGRDWQHWLAGRVGVAGEWLTATDRNAGRYRSACIRDARLHACLFVDPQPSLPSRNYLATLFAVERVLPSERENLLRGTPRSETANDGRIVCTCEGVGRRTIRTAIAAGADTIEAIGEAVRAGTGCGACVPELQALLAERLSKAG